MTLPKKVINNCVDLNINIRNLIESQKLLFNDKRDITKKLKVVSVEINKQRENLNKELMKLEP